MNGDKALEKVLTMQFHSVVDVGSGDGKHASILAAAGKEVATVSLTAPADFIGDYLDYWTTPVDCIWACHVLEHQPNVGLFLQKCLIDLKDDGIFAVTVPPQKPELVGGHLTVWTLGRLLYNMILAGFDCSKAIVMEYGYNISVIVRKAPAVLPQLRMDFGDIEALEQFFPFPVKHGDVF